MEIVIQKCNTKIDPYYDHLQKLLNRDESSCKYLFITCTSVMYRSSLYETSNIQDLM